MPTKKLSTQTPQKPDESDNVLAVFECSVKNTKTSTDHSPIITLELGEESIDAYNAMCRAEMERLYLRVVVIKVK